MNFSARLLARSLLALTLCSHALATDLLDNSFTWGYQVLSDRGAWKSDPGYGNDRWSDMALSEDRFPLVAYLDRTGTQPALHAVEWRDGNKQDVVIASPSSYYVNSIRVAASGSYAAVAWIEAPGTGSGVTATVKWSRRTETGWSDPETVFSGPLAVFDFKLDPAGNPVFAGAVYEVGGSLTPRVFVRTLSAGMWSEEPLAELSEDVAVGDIRLIFSQGQPQIAWREYDSHFGPAADMLFHAYKSANGWIQNPVTGGYIQAFFNGPQNKPALLTADSDTTLPQLSLFDGTSWSEPAAVPGIQEPVYSAATAPDGTIYAAERTMMAGIKGSSSSSTISPTCQVTAVGSDGTPHFLSQDGNTLRCLTRIAAGWSEEPVSTYEDGFTLEGLALAAGDQPKIFAASTLDDVVLSEGPLSWTRINSTLGYSGWSIALARNGQLRAAHLSGYYAYGNPGSLTQGPIPATFLSLSSSWRQGLALDSQDNPHISLISSSGNNTSIIYATRRGTQWTVETVAAGSSSPIHTGIAVGPDDTPWMIAPSGIYHRTSSGWRQDYAATNIQFGAIRVTSDSTVYAVYEQSPGKLYAVTGKNGIYQKELLENYSTAPGQFPALTLVDDRPVISFPALLDYYLGRYVPVFAERIGNYWRQSYMAPPADDQNFGANRYAVATTQGQILFADEKTVLKDRTYRQTIVLRRGQVPAPEPASLAIGQSTTSTGSHHFSMELPSLPIQQPLELQTSTDLKTWQHVVKFGPQYGVISSPSGLTARGDGFHTSLMLETPAGESARFVRLAPPN